MEQQPQSGVRKDNPQRDPSMDSAMSSVSSATSAAPSILSQGTNHSYHSSSETTVTTSSPHDANSLAAQATNNPKAVIEKLLGENKSLSSRNEQLWRLVEKQRQMVHGLHADLETALKDKERYRKRLKDYQQEPAPSIPRNAAVASEMKEAAQRNRTVQGSAPGSIASMDPAASSSRSPISPKSPRALPHQIVQSQDSQVSVMTDDSQSSKYSEDEAPVRNAADPTTSSLSQPPSSPTAPDIHQAYQSPATPKAKSQNAVTSPGEKSRKPVPAPLNLSHSAHSSAPPTDALNTQASASDYGDEKEIDDADLRLLEFERGRRRTRQEDDEQREIVALAEEARSRSEKSSKKTKSKTKADEMVSQDLSLPPVKPVSPTKQAPPLGMGLPTSPRAALPPSHIPATELQGPSGSIDSVLSPPDLPANASRSVTLPPKSPGLPMSPKPSDRPTNAPMPRAPVNGLASPGPLSPRQGLPLSPRAPKYPIPISNTIPSSSFTSASSRPNPDLAITTSMAERIQPNANSSLHDAAPETHSPSNEIYRGFVSEQFPNLLLSPSAIPHVTVKVWSSRLRPATHSNSASKGGDDDGVFTLGVHLRSTGRQLWRVEKKPSSLMHLDYNLRKFVRLKVSAPEKGIFSGHAPAKVDARRSAVNRFFQGMFETAMDDKTALIVCDYFSKETLPPEEKADLSSIPDSPISPKAKMRKEGYLSKKGKQFGGWKSRYFILDSQQLKHFESPGGAALGVIRLQSARIERPNTKDGLGEDDEYRHAFTILEPKRKDSSSVISHVLCAESDEERDGWVEALMPHIGTPPLVTESPPSSPRAAQSGSFSRSQGSFESATKALRGPASLDGPAAREMQTISYDDTIADKPPTLGTPTSNMAATPSPLLDDHSSSSTNASMQHPAISGPVAGGPIQNASEWGNKAASPTRTKDKEIKKRSMFGFMRSNLEEPQSAHGTGKRGLSPRPPTSSDKETSKRPVFGVPLAEAAEYSQPVGVNICIPSPVYRCIEYLESNNAASEEGIFRLSGSNTVIRHLKERFNSEKDINLVEGTYVDVHAVASLLKLYLRELPETILTKELHLDFQKVMEVEDKNKRIAAVNLLIHKLPEANREVLVALSSYLIKVVSNCEINRMTLKNVGIVFTPSLNMPHTLVLLFITDYDEVFTTAPTDPDTASPVLEDIATFKAEHPEIVNRSFAHGHARNLGAPTSSTSDSNLYQRANFLHSPQASQNSFTEHLAEQRHQLRQISTNKPRDGSPGSAPSSARSAGYEANPMGRRDRHSPSPASRTYKMPTPTSRTTPPPQANDGLGGDQPTISFTSTSSASSSPNSFVSSMRGRESPNISVTSTVASNAPAGDGYATTNAAATKSRKARRESAMLGNMNLGADPPDAARRKSSYTRLKENMTGSNTLREE